MTIQILSSDLLKYGYESLKTVKKAFAAIYLIKICEKLFIIESFCDKIKQIIDI